jgi:quaternary ammonium compound-resistance protein SugE
MSATWSWVILVFAGLLEVCWAVGLKYTEGFTKLIPTVLTLIALALSMLMLGKATQTLPIGTAYAVWVGIGSLGTGILGIFLFNEPATTLRLFFFGLLLFSIVGLKMTA